MNLDVTLNHNSHIDIKSIDEETYRFILTLQSSTSVSQVWELFLNVIDKAYPGMLKEAEFAYKSGTFNGALNTKIVPNCNNLKKKRILSREIDVNAYPFLEMAPNNVDETGYQCSGEEILIFTRSETYYIQVKMLFVSNAPFSLLTLQNNINLEDCGYIGKEKLSFLCRIFLNQMALRLKIENLEFHSIKDDLTTAYNQKYLRSFIQTEIERCNRYPSFFSIVFFDLDNLKAINDKYGHLTGTEVLKEVAYILGRQIRKIDLLSRFGGDEFVIVLLKANPKKAYETCCRIKKKLESTVFLKEKNLNITMTGCFGISGFPWNGSTVEELIKNADSAMYEVKRRGKNDIKIYEGV